MAIEIQSQERSNWEQSFQWLAALELGNPEGVVVPVNDRFLHERTKTLAVLFDLVPRQDLQRLPEIVASWSHRFRPMRTVTLSELRRVAREILGAPDKRDSVADLWDRVRSLCPWSGHAQGDVVTLAERSGLSEEEQRCYANGMHLWLTELLSNPLRSSLPGVLPGLADRPLAEVYVELFAVEESDVVQQDGLDGGKRTGIAQGLHAPAISVDSMIARTLERCVVVGDPGSGKSTLVKWLAWAAFHRRLPDFDVAIEIKLSAYASALNDDGNWMPLDFFFWSLGQSPGDAKAAARALRRAARQSSRYLLLLDGWDEVPVAQRVAVKESLLREERGFITLITSRPSGIPAQLITGRKVGYYRIAGLTPLVAEELTAKLLRQMERPDQHSRVWNRIRQDISMQEMAANPFLLGLLVSTLIHHQTEDLRTRAQIYRQITASIREQYESDNHRGAGLRSSHLDGLAELSFCLLNDPHTPRYVFTRREMERHLPGLDLDPVLGSRFVTKPMAALDEFLFLHATLQEYLAAEHLTHASSEEFHDFIERAFLSVSRLIVLEFLAGMDGSATAVCRAAAKQWWRTPDRFLRVAIRIARLAAAGRWPDDELGQQIRDALWAEISKEKDQDLRLCQSAVKAYADWDPLDLIRRVRLAPPSGYALNCLIEMIPAGIAREQRLDQLLGGEWQDVAGLDWMGGANEDEREELHRQLRDWTVPPEDLRESVLRVGGSRDESALPLLHRIVTGATVANRVREEAVTSIGRIGGPTGVRTLLDILLDARMPDELAGIAAVAFVQRTNPRLALDPRGRDRVMRRLAAIPPNARSIKNLLMVLEYLPVRDGAPVLAELATSSSLPRETNHHAIVALEAVVDRKLLENLVNAIDDHPPELTLAWLKLAWERSLPIRLRWLSERLSDSLGVAEQRRLLELLFQVLTQSESADRAEALLFVDRIVTHALQSEDDGLIKSVALALDHIASRRVILLSPSILRQAGDILVRAAHESIPRRRLLLAIAIVRHFRDSSARDALRRILERTQAEPPAEDRHDDYELFYDVGGCLAELAPEELLRIPADCPGVIWALRSRSLTAGWLVYSDRILNAEGQEITRLPANAPPAMVSTLAPLPNKPSPSRSLLLDEDDQDLAQAMKAIFVGLGVPLAQVRDSIDGLYCYSRLRIENEKERFYFRVALFRELLIAVEAHAPKMPKGFTKWPSLWKFLQSCKSEFSRIANPLSEALDEDDPKELLNRTADAILLEPTLVILVFGYPHPLEKANTFQRYARRWSYETHSNVIEEIRAAYPKSYSVEFGRVQDAKT